MSVYFEELLTSGWTWIRFAPNQSWIACQIIDTASETQRQKNKKLIRKETQVQLAFQTPINV